VEKIFWAMCPRCDGWFYCDYDLRFASVALICPFCEREFPVSESKEIDDRQATEKTGP
jgi:uncharacterized protein YbaR (Trm112 family)